MTQGSIWKDFFKRTVLPVAIALFLFFIFKSVFTDNGETNYFYVWLFSGIPFGIRRIFFWIIPGASGTYGTDITGTICSIGLYFIVSGIIGGFVLIWQLICAVWYIPLTIYRLRSIE